MGDKAFRDILLNHKVIFVYATAGDKGKESYYWKAREYAAMASTQFAVDTNALPNIGGCLWSCEFHIVNGHQIWRCAYGSTISYFMRLPDGGHEGEGFELYGQQSLNGANQLKLRVVTTVDGSAGYGNLNNGISAWTDFCQTISRIVSEEAQQWNATAIWINSHDPDPSSNPNDHSDHWAVGDALESVTFDSSINQSWFQGYSTRFLQANLDHIAVMRKAGLFVAYEKALAKSMIEQHQRPSIHRQDSVSPYFWVFSTYERR